MSDLSLKKLETDISGKANTNHNHNDATTSTSGFMSASDKTKLNGVAAGAITDVEYELITGEKYE